MLTFQSGSNSRTLGADWCEPAPEIGTAALHQGPPARTARRPGTGAVGAHKASVWAAASCGLVGVQLRYRLDLAGKFPFLFP